MAVPLKKILNSPTTNYQIIAVSALQSARIKFDTAVRGLKPVSQADRDVQSQLSSAWECYMDAKIVWNEFIESGNHGFIIARSNSLIRLAAEKYNLETTPVPTMGGDQPGYHRSSVVSAVLSAASERLRLVRKKVN